MMFAITSLIVAAATTASPTETPASKPAVQAVLTIGSGVADRQVKPLHNPETLKAGETVYAWTLVTGPGGGFVEHVWSCDGKAVARHYLPLGESKRWRTWSRHKLSAGQYRVEVLGPDGAHLQETTFTVLPASKD
jgi:hypothetical protein